jgi:hypothetical protein
VPDGYWLLLFKCGCQANFLQGITPQYKRLAPEKKGGWTKPFGQK